MSNSSNNMTAGDGLSLASDVVKLLAPVLKGTDKAKFERLKSKSKMVQDVFRKMLDDEPVVRDYGDPYEDSLVRFTNNTMGEYRIELNRNFRFIVQTHSVEAGDGTMFEVRILGYDIANKVVIDGVEYRFEKLLPLLETEGFVSIKRFTDDFCPFNYSYVEDKLISELATLELYHEGGQCRLEIKITGCNDFVYHDDVPVDREALIKSQGALS